MGFLICLKNAYVFDVFLIFCEFFNFAFTLLCNTTGPQLTYLCLKGDAAGYIVLSGHLGVSFLAHLWGAYAIPLALSIVRRVSSVSTITT